VQTDQPGAEEATARALALARRLGARSGEAFTGMNLAGVQLLAGRWDEAAATAETASTRNPGDRRMVLWGQTRLMVLHFYRGEVDAALASAGLAAELRDSEDIQDRPLGGLADAIAAKLTGDGPGALDGALFAVRESLSGGLFNDVFRMAWPLAIEFAAAAGRDDDVAELLAQVDDRPVGHVPRYLRADAARYRAALLGRRAGDPEEVEHLFRDALRQMSELGYPYWQALCQRDLGGWLRAHDRHDEAAPLLAAALATFTRLSAEPAAAGARELLAEQPSKV
jgi:tetratricopeptide (TPR) repeat protein